jgi:hypothetical protein
LYLFIRSSKSSSLVQEGQAPYLEFLGGLRLIGATLFLPKNTQRRYSIFFKELETIKVYCPNILKNAVKIGFSIKSLEN